MALELEQKLTSFLPDSSTTLGGLFVPLFKPILKNMNLENHSKKFCTFLLKTTRSQTCAVQLAEGTGTLLSNNLYVKESPFLLSGDPVDAVDKL